MWKLYARETDGIVIKTDFASLKKSFTCSEGVNIGRVSYVDYESTIIPEDNVLSPFLHKRKSFEHELEVRAIHILHRGDERSKLRDEEIGGAYYEVDLSLLIKEVIVAPFAPERCVRFHLVLS